MNTIRLHGLTKAFDGQTPALSGVDLFVTAGERVSVIGPSGAGKTTLLRVIAGLEKPDSGSVFLGDRDVTQIPPEARDLGFVFQHHALYPHLTAEENLAFPLRLRTVARDEIRARVEATAKLLNLEAVLKRRPAELSGGEAQRVALGRALIRNPAALLMDEPLSSLPPDLRLKLRHELVRIHAADPKPLLYVTHDHEDALALGQRVVVMNGGVLQQIGTPREIYEEPANRFVAAFIGKPSMNFIEMFAISGARNLLPRARLPDAPSPAAMALGIRPEHLEICSSEDAWVHASVDNVQYGGAHSDVVLRYSGGELVMRHFGDCKIRVGDSLPVRATPQHSHWFDAAGKRVTGP